MGYSDRSGRTAREWWCRSDADAHRSDANVTWSDVDAHRSDIDAHRSDADVPRAGADVPRAGAAVHQSDAKVNVFAVIFYCVSVVKKNFRTRGIIVLPEG